MSEIVELTREQIIERIAHSAIRHANRVECCNCGDRISILSLADLLEDGDPALSEYAPSRAAAQSADA